MKEKLENMGGCCIAEHPSLKKSAFHVLSLLLENGRFEARGKRGALEQIEERRHVIFGSWLMLVMVSFFIVQEVPLLRVQKFRATGLWPGLGNRLEIPACARSAIMRSFPSQEEYLGFRVCFKA
ncbi:hypothetical protein Y032_0192g1361 [Ancylostoma ceylanicum]|uniref:Uncharacterized protein n=1 Tax=Ancylostoma ceylanicum TaxID=53326 RepID=A0A016SQG4_9BILA|nr:hypothetical protein Y032_0192g1361 [Ancylostoma ceylanicum]